MIFSIRYLQGENYDSTKSIYEQDLLEHSKYMYKLSKQGKILLAGPFTDNTGSEIIMEADDEKEVLEIIEKDPAIQKSIFSFEIKIWDIKSGQCLHTLNGCADSTPSFLVKEGKLITGYYDGTIRIFCDTQHSLVHSLIYRYYHFSARL